MKGKGTRKECKERMSRIDVRKGWETEWEERMKV
jgi:hypothetical protein